MANEVVIGDNNAELIAKGELAGFDPQFILQLVIAFGKALVDVLISAKIAEKQAIKEHGVEGVFDDALGSIKALLLAALLAKKQALLDTVSQKVAEFNEVLINKLIDALKS